MRVEMFEMLNRYDWVSTLTPALSQAWERE
jgi:hypothetical protein